MGVGIALSINPGSARNRRAVPVATPAGKAEFCIPHRQIRESLVRSDSVIDFKMLGGKIYRVTIPGGCPGLGFEERFGYSTSLDRLCASDIITVLYTSPISSGARCPLGPFQPVTLAPPEK
ncbi:MAG: hypothetical protein B7Y47_05220 [Sphingomonas sp. 28-63-12]|nr:MAG: hypothetical protein B7Y47_05220 [Sphingomonas sp. 28-63-12]